jgi:hypothetical protein
MEADARENNPPANVIVIVTCAGMFKGEREAVREMKAGAVRWKILKFDCPTGSNRFAYRGWKPDSWRYKDEGKIT